MKTFITIFVLAFTLSSTIFGDDLYGTYNFPNSTYPPSVAVGFSSIGTFSNLLLQNFSHNFQMNNQAVIEGWSTNSSRDDNQYAYFTVTLYSPNNFNGMAMTLKFDNYIWNVPSVSPDHGPTSGEVMYRFGNSGSFSSAGTWFPPTSWANSQFSIPQNNSTQNVLTIRIHGWNAVGTTQFNRIYLRNMQLSGPSFPTPVELTSFTANVINQHVVLNWKTSTETDNYGFDIERLSDNRVWEKVGFVNGSGNSSSPKDYSFIDKTANTGKYSYRLKQIDANGAYSYSQEVEADLGIPAAFNLEQNYPNPFNPSTIISYQLPLQSSVQIDVFNSIGEKVAELVNEVKEAGYYEVEFNASSLSSGVYFYNITAGNFKAVKKMTLMR